MSVTEGNSAPAVIDVAKVIDIVSNRQTQYYTLWGFYTVVQFSAAGFGSDKLTFNTALAVFFGVWAFNLGHLAFVLACVAQLNRLVAGLDATLTGSPGKEALVREAFLHSSSADYFWKYWGCKMVRRGFWVNTFVHFFIDVCASTALFYRVGIA